MIRTNLLPREIVERRKWERWYPIVFLIAAIALAVVLAVIVGLFLMVQNSRTILQSTQNDVVSLQTKAQQFAIFEQREQSLQARKAIAGQALAGRVNWAQVCNDLSLVLPDEVWITGLVGAPDGTTTKISFAARTPNMDPRSESDGLKSAAITLVRIASVPEFYDVWMSSANGGQFNPVGTSNAAATTDFGVSARVKKNLDTSSTTSPFAVPAPPSTPGQ